MTSYYISTTGSDTTGDGTIGNPYLTVDKCLEVCSNGDSIKALTGTYTITSTTNVTKQVTITSDSGNKTDVIFDSNTTIFNIQSNNITITQLTLQTSSTNELITIDRMSDGSIIPTFFNSIVVSNCNIKYVTNALSLNGSFSVTSNTFTRQSGSNVVDIIKVYSSRETCNISSNTFTDSGPVQYVLYFTSIGSGTYFDMCNSKGGSFNIVSNTVTNTNGSQSTSFIQFDYFNQYLNAVSSEYNINTKLSLSINNNTLSLSTKGKFFYINTTSNDSYSMFKTCNINTNTIDNTEYGILHLGKNVNNTTLTISSSDISRSLFKIYSNVLDTQVIPYLHLRTNYGINLSGGYVQSWTDLYGNNVPATKSGTANYPSIDTSSESFPFITFGTGVTTTSNGNNFEYGPKFLKFSQGLTLFMVVRLKNVSGFEQIAQIQSTSLNFNIILARNFDNTQFNLVIYTTLNSNSTIFNQVNGTWQILAFKINNAGSHWYNGTGISFAPAARTLSDGTFDQIEIGGKTNVNNNFVNMDIREYILYEEALSDATIISKVNSLKTYYGL